MIKFDHTRKARIGLPESVFCEHKSAAMVDEIITQLVENTAHPTLFTRLDEAKFATLDPALAEDAAALTVQVARAALDAPWTPREPCGITGRDCR